MTTVPRLWTKTPGMFLIRKECIKLRLKRRRNLVVVTSRSISGGNGYDLIALAGHSSLTARLPVGEDREAHRTSKASSVSGTGAEREM